MTATRCGIKVSLRVLLLSIVFSGIAACTAPAPYSQHRFAPLTQPTGQLSSTAARQLVTEVDLLALSPDIIDYFDAYVKSSQSHQQRALMLHRLIRSPAFLGIEYREERTYSAKEVFLRGEANCISYSNLLIALARHYGLRADYRMIEPYPDWSRSGGVLKINIHVNTLLQVGNGAAMVLDIDRRSNLSMQDYRTISDREARALFYNNLATDAFTVGDYTMSYAYLLQAIDLAPDFPLLWTNLGALYRSNEQWSAAEQSYQVALQLNSSYYSALNNLAVLYYHSGRMEEYRELERRVLHHRQRNPYYHLALAKQLYLEGEQKKAEWHLQKAALLKNDDPDFNRLLEQLRREGLG